MKSTIFIIMMLIASSAYGQRAQETKKCNSCPCTTSKDCKNCGCDENARPKKPPVDMAELIFKRIDSNHNGSISLKEFQSAFPRLRHSLTHSPQRPTRSTHGRTRGFDGKAPGFNQRGNSRSRGGSR
jgi:hypothetical protein